MPIKNVVLDPGHGGIDLNGKYTTAPYKMHKFPNGEIAYEGVLNRQIMGHVYTCLRSHKDLNVVCTVKEDDPRDISLGWRVKKANEFKAKETIFISIHCNAFNGEASGFEIYTSVGHTKSDVLAESIADVIEPLYKNVNLRLRFDISDGDKDKEKDFYVLRKTKCPAVLLEILFFDNRDDSDKLKDINFQCEVALKISEGLLKFIESEKG